MEASGHMMEVPITLMYSSLMVRETVRIALMIAALNDLEVKISDIKNAFLAAPCAETINMFLGPEFGEDQGKTAVIVHALYGLARTGVSFWNQLADCMHHPGYNSCLVDPNLWHKPMVHASDNFQYYSYILLYMDHCLCISHKVVAELNKVDKLFTMTKGSIGNPDVYWGE